MTQLREPIPYKLIVGLFSAAAAIYCISVIYYVSTSADLGIRCLVNKEQPESSGILIRQFELPADHLTRLLPSSFGPAPVAGDHLLELNDQPIHSFASFSKALAGLRSALSEDGSFDSRVEEANPLDIDRYASLPGVIKYSSLERQNSEQEENSSESRTKRAEARYVRVKYRSASTGAEELCWLMLRPQSTLEIVLSIIWSLLEFSVLALAALAYSTRPNDHAARVFYLLSLLTIPAFVGGYHWWVISANPLLTFPFAISAILVPVVTLHFFLSYPRRHPILKQNGSGRLLLIYLPPAIMITLVSILLSIGYLRFNPQVPLQSDDLLMTSLRYSIDIYIMISVVYYGISMAVMFANMRANLQTAEQMQMRWIIGAACLALPLVLYTVYLAYADRVGMALGRGRIPMIIVSLLFLGAYAIGIIRYRLMLIDQILSRRMLYLCTSQLITLAYSLLIAAGALWTVYRGISIPEQVFPMAIIFTLGILALGRLRDVVQEVLDRRFFREKYRLDRAMHQMQVVMTKVADVPSLADRMLRSCREVLQSRFCALYLRDGKRPQFDLVSAVNAAQLPVQIQLDDETTLLIEKAGSSQRIAWEGRTQIPRLQQLHRDLNSQFIHAFDVDGKLSGLVVLGSKSSSMPYTAEDTTFVTAIGQMTGVALQCVRIQQNVSRLDNMLQEKTRKIEAQERQISILKQQLASIAQEDGEDSTPAIEQKPAFQRGRLIGSSPAIVKVLSSAEKVARSDTSVLIRGESGTGKELLAQAIHANSQRRNEAMVSVNCAALSPALLESELFGHVKGAFTGAYRDTTGRFQMADRGTLFLDEIGDLPADVQVKLLRVLQERKFEPVGGRESISVDVRVLAATHQDLEQRIRDGLFRQDLYYRLNVITLTLPPLRERKEDLLNLSLSFLREAAEKSQKKIRDIDDLALQAISNYHWPGNIRELQNAIHRAVVLADSDIVLFENLPLEVQGASLQNPKSIFDAVHSSGRPASSPSSKKNEQISPLDLQDADEQSLLLSALNRCHGNKAKAARLLGIPRSTFYSKLKKYDLS